MFQLVSRRAMVSLVALSVLGGQVYGADKVEVTKVNNVFKKIITEVLAERQKKEGNAFKTIEFAVDEAKTDLSSDDSFRVRASAKITVTKTRWNDKQDSSLRLEVEGGADRAKKAADVQVKLGLDTSTLSLFNYVAAEIETLCRNQKDVPDSEAEAHKKQCDNLKKMSESTRLGEWMNGALDVALVEIGKLKAKIVKLEADIAAEQDATRKKSLETELSSKQKELEISLKIQAEISRSIKAAGDTDTFTLRFKDLYTQAGEGGKVALSTIEIFLDKTKLDISGRVDFTEISDIEDYFKVRQSIQESLVKLQQESEEDIKNAKEAVNSFLDLVELVLVKKD